MDVAKTVSAWVFTNGSNAGTAKLLGLCRARSGWDVPLIAVTMLEKVVHNDVFQTQGDSIYSPLGAPVTGAWLQRSILAERRCCRADTHARARPRGRAGHRAGAQPLYLRHGAVHARRRLARAIDNGRSLGAWRAGRAPRRWSGCGGGGGRRGRTVRRPRGRTPQLTRRGAVFAVFASAQRGRASRLHRDEWVAVHAGYCPQAIDPGRSRHLVRAHAQCG